MTEQQAFIKQIVNNPKDELARLIYADWLDDYGSELDSEYARFIRVSIEFNKAHYPSEEYTKLLNEIEHLWGSWPDDNGIRTMFHGSVPKVNGYEGWSILPYGLHENLDLSLPCAVVKGGFVDGLHVPTSFLICRSCGGGGRLLVRPDVSSECGNCGGGYLNGTGLGNSEVKAMFEQHPVTRINLMHKTPRRVSDSLGEGYTWSANHRYLGAGTAGDRDLFTVHDAVGKAVALYVSSGVFQVLAIHRTETEQEAKDLMSEALVTTCRRHAGLPRIDLK